MTEPASPPDEGAFDELAALYGELAEELGATSVRCDLRGLCCDFDRSDHVLFSTDLEVRYARARGGTPVPEAAPGACPWFVGGTCRLRDGRPLSCRVYFCDPDFADEMSGIAERYHRSVIRIHERHGIPYRYSRFVETVRERSP